jgi:hypothetical protein
VGWSGATGTLANGELIVRFSLKMELSDFEDAAYRARSGGTCRAPRFPFSIISDGKPLPLG